MNSTFRATASTAYLQDGGRLEVARQMAAHEPSRITELYERRGDGVDIEEVEADWDLMKEMPMTLPAGYADLLADLKQRIQTAQLRASLAVNRELILLYWGIGREILQRQANAGWGSKVIERLARDLHAAFPDTKGFSRTNLLYMRAFVETWPEESFVQQVVGQIPWGHNLRLLDLVKDPSERLWYVQQTLANGWSRNVLVLQIEAELYRRQGRAITNFDRTLPSPQSDLAQQITKDPYNFDFLSLGPEAHERDLERGLIEHMRDFLLELGVGFAFVGSQYRIQVGQEEFWIDLLFYHVKLRAYVVIDLKMQAFRPEFAGYGKPDVMKRAA